MCMHGREHICVYTYKAESGTFGILEIFGLFGLFVWNYVLFGGQFGNFGKS